MLTFSGAFAARQQCAVHPEEDREKVQNLVLLATRTPIEFDDAAAAGATNMPRARLRGLPEAAGYLLSDDFAPVEYLVSDR